MPEIYCSFCAVIEIEAVEIKHCKSVLGQGVMEW
jgi:hypothetical protein